MVRADVEISDGVDSSSVVVEVADESFLSRISVKIDLDVHEHLRGTKEQKMRDLSLFQIS